MMVEAVTVVLAQLNQYIQQADGEPVGSADVAILGNIAQLEIPEVANELENRLILTLVNAEEESALKNGNVATREPGGAVTYQNRPLFLNLCLLFTANYRKYETALRRLAQVFAFFQGKRTFTSTNSPEHDAVNGVFAVTRLSLTMDLLSLTFEDISHLWGSLGGKQLPFAAYRGRLVAIQDPRVLDVGGTIREIEVRGRNRH
jgi:hypothetical protein